ncbi:MAG: insulinase family protein, partial [Deltaproteobacteria bacterium]
TPAVSSAPPSGPPVAPVSSAPPRAAEEEMRPPTPVHREIAVIEQRNEASPLVTIRVVFESGSADDPGGREGATHLAARLMAEGGTEALTYEELSRRLFPMAARVGFHVDRDMTVFVGQVHRDHVAAFYPLLRDMLLHPRLADEDFRRVRSQTQTGLTELRGNDDEALGQEFLQSLIYANHPYGHPAIGTERGLAALTLEDLRTQRGRVFCRDRVLVGIAGGYPAGLVTDIRRDMESLPAQCATRAPLPVVTRPHGVHVVVIDKPDASSVAISLGFPMDLTRASADFPAVQFVTNFVGLHRQSSGVLYQSLREARGLNYGDYAYAENFAQDGWSRFPRTNIQRRQQYASIWIRPVRPATAHFALRAAVRALALTLEHGMPAADFTREQTFLAGYLSLYAQTESQRLGYALDDASNHATQPFNDQLRAAWSALDRDAAAATARRYLRTQDLWVAIVSPNGQALADAIAHETPSPITYDSPKPAEILAEDQLIQRYALAARPDDVRVVPLAEVFR